MSKHLIVNADDFGLSPGVNRGIAESAEHGILTSASLMVRQPAAEAAAALARGRLEISVGLHLDLGEWVYRNGEWVPLYSVVANQDPAAVAGEVARQFEQFQKLMGRPPTHIDSHQHVHRDAPVRSIVADLARRLNVPLRDQAAGIVYCGDFYGQTAQGDSMPDALRPCALVKILEGLPDGVTELGCHPGFDDGLATAYRVERAVEVRTLCSPVVRDALGRLGIELCSFEDFAKTS